MELKIKKLDIRAFTPTYGTPGAACFDLYSLTEGSVLNQEPLTCNTGLSVRIPEGYAMLIFSRSGQGFNHDIRLANCVGVIDSDYRGEVKVKLTGDDILKQHYVNIGDRIAQAMLVPLPKITFKEVDYLGETERGAGGFGSTDKQG